MTRQSVTNLLFSVFVVLFLAYLILVQWTGDVQQGAFRNPELVRWSNRILVVPTVAFGVYAVFLGVRTLREGKYPPPGSVVPFAPKREVNWSPVSTGAGLILGGVCAAIAPFVIASVVGF